jgi:hypothetical protein
MVFLGDTSEYIKTNSSLIFYVLMVFALMLFAASTLYTPSIGYFAVFSGLKGKTL